MALFESAQDALDYEQMLNMLSQGFPVQRPKAVLFGDSMSEYVGYNPDGSVDTRYGQSVADVISKNLGIPVQNLATGGETSYEALAGSGQKFGGFADFIAQNRPEYAILRYGAADAIKSQDPQKTLDSLRQMIEVSLANGTTPVLVGVSELYGSQNSKTGNIAGYIDPGAEQRATQINDGIAALARQYGVTFTDVRSAVSAGSGDLLDGVHSNADFGKKMADAISESIVQQNAITGVSVPQLPANVESLSAQEKGRLYNDLISQGYSDAQIRTAARAESDQDWNALKQIAASVKNTTPAAIEQQAVMQTPQSATSVGEPAGTQQFSGLFGGGGDLVSQAQQVLAASGKANDSRFADSIVGSFTQNGVVYNVQGDGSIQGIIETPTGAYTIANYTPEGQQVNEQFSNQFEQSSTDRLLGTLANAAIAAGTGIALGPAGIGLLGAPAATAIGSGVTTFANTGSVQDALKAAAIAGGTAYGIGELLPTSPAASEAQFIAYDAAQQAQQGLSAEQISMVLQASGVSPSIATNVAAAAAEGLTPAQIINEVGNLTFTGSVTPQTVTPTVPSAAEQVVVTGQNLGALSNLSPLLESLAPAVTAAAIPSAVPPSPTTQTVTVESQPMTQQTTVSPETVANIVAAPVETPSTAPQTVTVAGQRVLPENIGQMSGVEKATLYNSLLAQGLTDQQVRVIAERELGTGATEGWDSLTSLAASLLNPPSTPTQTVNVQAQPATQETPTAQETTGGLLGSTVTPTQSVNVSGERVLPENIENMSLTEKAAVYNNLLAQGLTDQQVRIITERELGAGSTEGWEYLTQAAAQLGTVPSTSQTVNVTANRPVTTQPETVAGTVISALTPSVPVGSQTVDVTGQREVTAEDFSVPINTFIPALAGVAPLTPNLPTPGAPAPNNSLFNPNDILKLLTTIGGLGLGAAAGGSGGGINMGTPPPSDPRLGTTTPQYGDDYYAAVQRYYNAYMPETPRNVAGPLQQWYENKYGA
jgi:lysophospholipase L1-like esterase